MNNIRHGVCCIILSLGEKNPPKKFQRMTYKKFSETPRDEALKILSKRILNNIDVTYHSIKYCFENNYCYRISSDLFPLITYEKADLSLEQLPDYEEIQKIFSLIKDYLISHPVRISCHPSEFNVLASENQDAVNRTIKELNFYSRFMDQIGCPANYDSPINFHINNNVGDRTSIVNRFLKNAEKLDDNCWSRIVIENDDKAAGWSVNKLYNHFHSLTKKPITFDYLHFNCYPDGMVEEEAFLTCKETWGKYKPLFHYSESREGKNPRAHADYPKSKYKIYGDCEIDIDFEFKMKEKAIEEFLKL
jgi:UV DNA damage endonuclease